MATSEGPVGAAWMPQPGDHVQTLWDSGDWRPALVEEYQAETGLFLVRLPQSDDLVEFPPERLRAPEVESGGLSSGELTHIMANAKSLRDRASIISSLAKQDPQLEAERHMLEKVEATSEGPTEDESDAGVYVPPELLLLSKALDSHPVFSLGDKPASSDPTVVRLWKRNRVIREILETEALYVCMLEAMTDVFINPLKNSDPDQYTDDPKGACSTLFSNSDILAALNRQFYSDIKARVLSLSHENQAEHMIGDLFVSFAPYFRMYSQYVNNHEAATRLLERVSQDQKFARLKSFLEDGTLDRRCRGLNVASILIMPIQRIPRYKLLLSEVYKYTQETEPDYPQLAIAVQKVQEVAKHINEAIRMRQNRDTIRTLQSQFTSDPHFISPSRRFIRQGPLIKKCSSGLKRYEFFLFNDMLAYARQVGWKYKLHQKIPIDAAFEVSDLPDILTREKSSDSVISAPSPKSNAAPGSLNRLLIINSQKSFICNADDLPTKISWIEDLEDCLADFAKTNQKLHAENVKRAPVSGMTAGNFCTLCNTQFSLFNRKKDCRFCGKAVCHSCSLSRLKLGVQGKDGQVDETPKRVCDSCAVDVTEMLSSTETRSRDSSGAAPLTPTPPAGPPPNRPPPLPPKTKELAKLLELARQTGAPRASVKFMDAPELASDDDEDSDSDDENAKGGKQLASKAAFKAKSTKKSGVLPVNSKNFSKKTLENAQAVIMLSHKLKNDKKTGGAWYRGFKSDDQKQASRAAPPGGQDSATAAGRAAYSVTDHFLTIDGAKNTPSSSSQDSLPASHRTVYYIKIRTRRGGERTVPKLYAHFREFHSQWSTLYANLFVKYKLPRLTRINDSSPEIVEQRRKELEDYLQGVSTVPDLADTLSDFLGIKAEKWTPDQKFYDAHNDWQGAQRTAGFGALLRSYERRASGDYQLAGIQATRGGGLGVGATPMVGLANSPAGKAPVRPARPPRPEEKVQRVEEDDDSGKPGFFSKLGQGISKMFGSNKRAKDDADKPVERRNSLGNGPGQKPGHATMGYGATRTQTVNAGVFSKQRERSVTEEVKPSSVAKPVVPVGGKLADRLKQLEEAATFKGVKTSAEEEIRQAAEAQRKRDQEMKSRTQSAAVQSPTAVHFSPQRRPAAGTVASRTPANAAPRGRAKEREPVNTSRAKSTGTSLRKAGSTAPAQSSAGPVNFCDQCGQKRVPGWKFCDKCGSKFPV